MTGELELVFGMVLCYFTVSGTVILFTWSYLPVYLMKRPNLRDAVAVFCFFCGHRVVRHKATI